MKRIFLILVLLLLALASPGWGTTTIDSYSESHYNPDFSTQLDGGYSGISQSFTGSGISLDTGKFYVSKTGNPGNAYIKLYAHSGTFGTDSVPTGAALATSDAVTGASGTPSLVTGTFSTPYTPANGTKYCLTFEYVGTGTDYYTVFWDGNSPSHGGNFASQWGGGSWTANGGRDVIFYAISNATEVVAPTVTTQAVSDLENTTCTGNGNVTDDGGGTITERGFAYATHTSPTKADSYITVAGTTGAFSGSITSLTADTPYYVAAYAINSAGTTYATAVTFKHKYYISAAGNDTSGAPDDIDHPYLTIGKINSLSISPGSSILFNKGDTWYQSADSQYIQPGAGGVSGSYGKITYSSYGNGNKPVLHKGHGTPLSSWTDLGGGKYSKAFTATAVYSAFEDDKNLGNPASGSDLNDGYWYFSSNTFYYKPTSGVADDHVVRPAISNNLVYLTSRSNIKVDGLALLGGPVSLSITSGTVIQNCDISEGGAIFCNNDSQPEQSNVTISNNNMSYCGAPTIYFEGNVSPNITGLTVSYNTITNPNKTQFDDRWVDAAHDNDAIYLQNMTNLLVEHNSITSTNCDYAAAIHLWHDGAVSNIGNIIRYNYINGTPGHGILLSGGSTATTLHCDIYYNIVANYGTATPIPAFGNHWGGIWVTGQQTSGSPSTVSNNTAYNGDIGYGLGSSADYWVFKNNISHTQSVYHFYKTELLTHNTVNYNCFYPDTGTKFNWEGTDYNFADWKTNSSQDVNSITSNPLFLNAGGSYALATDFKLKPQSPCINKGTSVGLTRDYFNKVVPQGGAVDIGASEYQGGVGFW